jgi:tetratricopeptide (TPR) repeat protein
MANLRHLLLALIGFGAWSGLCLNAHGDQPSPPPLYENLGILHHPITTSSPRAQQYFDQGLRLIYAFNHEEAEASFEEAARLDPEAAMAFWGMALALGPNINAPMDPGQAQRAYELTRRAAALAGRASSSEQAYINALAARYAPGPDQVRRSLDEAYAEAMREVWRRHMQDADAGVLYTEALMNLQPWDYWTADGRPKGKAEEIVGVLERVLTFAPDHPGACHYYIHAVEASDDPARGLPCADRLPKLMPGAGHLVHMPAHIYLRVGRYREAAAQNAQAAAVDHDYLAHRHLAGNYPTAYYPHNVHFLWAALTMEGRGQEAIDAARNLLTLVPWQKARNETQLEEFTPTLLFALVRFGKWDELLTMPAPPPELRYTTAVWRYTLGVAMAATGRFDGAAQEHRRLAALLKTLPEAQMIGFIKVADLVRIAERVLAGEIAARQHHYEEAIGAFQEAVKVEDALRYHEPSLWHYPVRHSLGAVLLASGRAVEAEDVYRQDLRHHPENGWALFGLARSLRAQKRSDEADLVEAGFRKAWHGADTGLEAAALKDYSTR